MPERRVSTPLPAVLRPGSYLWWLVRCQKSRVALAGVFGTLWLVAMMVLPYLLSRAVDKGIRPGNLAATVEWSLAIAVAGALVAVFGVLRHRTMTRVRMEATFGSLRLLVRHAVGLGASLTENLTAGEVVTVGATDVAQVSQTLTIAGPGVGSLVAYGLAAYLLLTTSVLLGVTVLLGVPVLVCVARPLIGRLQVRQDAYRAKDGALTGMAGDIARGLQVLCGLGGKEQFRARYIEGARQLRDTGYGVGAVTSWIDGLSAGVPTVFLGIVIWLGAWQAVSGAISVGQLVAVYGYTVVLVTPIEIFLEETNDLGRGLVAAGRVVRFLALQAGTRDQGTAERPASGSELSDPATGLVVRPGQLLAVCATRMAEALDLAGRLARRVDSDVEWGGIPLSSIRLAEVRQAIVFSGNDAYIFSGSLRDVLGATDDDTARAALEVASADDILTTLSDGLLAGIGTQARNLSGGQRQRVQLARCLVADPEILILAEPTSAVDISTEARIVERVRARRAGRTTVVISTSPQWLARADAVAFLAGSTVAAVGPHAALAGSLQEYRDLIASEDGTGLVARQYSVARPPGSAVS